MFISVNYCLFLYYRSYYEKGGHLGEMHGIGVWFDWVGLGLTSGIYDIRAEAERRPRNRLGNTIYERVGGRWLVVDRTTWAHLRKPVLHTLMV